MILKRYIMIDIVKELKMEQSIKMDKLTLGVCYYPEHWEEHLWEDDLNRMLDHGIEVIRIAEFAWNKFEPFEGKYSFEFFDRFMEKVKASGMKVIFCTPTATPPAWLTQKYPEVLNAKEDGTLYRHGMRRHYNYNSLVYQELTSKIVHKIAEHYCSHTSIIGWQIDNELNCETNVYYSEADHKAFREYLKDKFKTLDALNTALGTTFWNQTYTSWEEIHLARPTVSNSNNPHMALEEKRFVSKSTIGYCKLQADIIKQYNTKGQFITTNGLFGHIDNHEMVHSNLDFITYDSYPNFGFALDAAPKAPGNLKDRNWSFNLSKTRAISPNFGIMEQQSGPGGWDSRMLQPSPKPGQMRLWTMQSIAHGADFVSYFRWRTCCMGTEIYWHGLNDYSNLPNRRLTELKHIHKDVQKLSNLPGSTYKADIALIKDYDNEWDGEQDQWHGPLNNFSENGWFTASQLTHTPMDILYLNDSNTSIDDLKKYKLLVYPHATILTEHRARLLRSYVTAGGTLIMGARTGYKDITGKCPMMAMPGYAAEICGVRVTDFTNLGPADSEEFIIWEDTKLEAPIFNDILEVTTGEVLGHFDGNYYTGAPGLVKNKLGKGTSYYFGGGFSTQTAEKFLLKLGYAEPYGNLLSLPPEAELAIRTKNDQDYIFVLNYMPFPVELTLNTALIETFEDKLLEGKLILDQYGVFVFTHRDV